MTLGTTGNYLGCLILDGIATRRIKCDHGAHSTETTGIHNFGWQVNREIMIC